MATFQQRMQNPRDRIYMTELLKEIGKLETKEDRVLLLREFANRSPENLAAMKNFMQVTWHPNIDIDLPKPGAPEYTSEYLDYNMAPGQLKQAFAKVKYFVKTSPQYIQSPLKRETIFVQILEGLFGLEAKLFVMMKDKKIDKRIFPHVDEALLRAAFAGWLPVETQNPTEEQSDS